MEGDIEDVDGVLKITTLRIHYRFKIPVGAREKAERVLAVYDDACPAYQTLKDCIQISWKADIQEA